MSERVREEIVEGQVPRTHELKVWPAFFHAIEDGSKTFEWRKNDRGFRRGDTLRLREWDPNAERYTGRELLRTVSYMLTDLVGGDFGFPEGYAVLALAARPASAEPVVVDDIAQKLWGHFGRPGREWDEANVTQRCEFLDIAEDVASLYTTPPAAAQDREDAALSFEVAEEVLDVAASEFAVDWCAARGHVGGIDGMHCDRCYREARHIMELGATALNAARAAGATDGK